MYNDHSSPVLANVTFSGNFAGGSGGGMYNIYNSSPSLTKTSTFSGTALEATAVGWTTESAPAHR